TPKCSIAPIAFTPERSMLSSSVPFKLFLTPMDWLVFIFILLLTGLFAWYGQRNTSRHDYWDLLLMGRKLTLPLFVATMVATWYGGVAGVTQIAFETGLYNFLTQGIFWYLTYFLFAFFL